MAFTAVDWLVLAAILALPLGVGLYYYRRAGSSVDQFFLSGRDLPWWLAGTSMVATTFAADTPLAVTGIVAAHGIAGNWLWWNAGLGSMLTVFFFARLWRRAGILADVEFVELRYAGRPAAFLRGFRASYLGLPINCLIIGWVNLAMAKILSVTLGWDRLTAVFVGLAATGCYAALSGLRGIVVADFLQFALAIFGTTVLAYVALSIPAIGGLEGLTNQLPPTTFRLMPSVGVDGSGSDVFALSVTAFIAYLGIQWWASWYPGQEPGGGGHVAQRMMSAKDERHSLLGDPLVFGRPLLHPAMAVDYRRPDLTCPVPEPRGPRVRLCVGSARPSPGRNARPARRFVLRGLYVHRLDPTQLGHVVSGQRPLCPLHPTTGGPAGTGPGIAGSDRRGDAAQRPGDLLLGERTTGVGVRPGVRGRDRPRSDSSLVLAACKRGIGDRRPRRGRPGFPRHQVLHDHRLSRHAPLSRPLDHGVLACSHLADPGGADDAPGRFLQTGPPRRTGMATCANSCRCT